MRTFGVHSEVGKLRTVMVCRPGLAHQRLTPGNCHDLLFDDVIWVHEAQKDHYDFALKMQERGVEVLELHDMLAQALEVPDGRRFVLDRRITANAFGPLTADMIRPWLDEMPARQLAAHLIGGIAISDLPDTPGKNFLAEAFGQSDFLMPPIPNTLFQRDPSCWIYNGVTCNPMFWPARKPETLIQRTIYKFNPLFAGGDFRIWWGDSDEPFEGASMEGGDVMPIGKGVVLIGMGERTTRQAVAQVARELFRHGAATRVIACQMPKSRAAMHLDTVFTFLDRDAVTVFREVADQVRCYSIYPKDAEGGIDVRVEDKHLLDIVKEALGLQELRVIATGGNSFEAEREQWDDGNNVVAIEPGVVVAYDCRRMSDAFAERTESSSSSTLRRRFLLKGSSLGLCSSIAARGSSKLMKSWSWS